MIQNQQPTAPAGEILQQFTQCCEPYSLTLPEGNSWRGKDCFVRPANRSKMIAKLLETYSRDDLIAAGIADVSDQAAATAPPSIREPCDRAEGPFLALRSDVSADPFLLWTPSGTGPDGLLPVAAILRDQPTRNFLAAQDHLLFAVQNTRQLVNFRVMQLAAIPLQHVQHFAKHHLTRLAQELKLLVERSEAPPTTKTPTVGRMNKSTR